MWNSKVVLTGCLFLCTSGIASAQSSAYDNLPPTADDLIRTFSGSSEAPPPATPDLPSPAINEESGDSKPFEFSVESESLAAPKFKPQPKADVPAIPMATPIEDAPTEDDPIEHPEIQHPPIENSIQEPWSASNSTAVFGLHEIQSDYIVPAVASNGGCGQSCQPYRSCVGDDTCRMLTFYSGFAFMSRSDPDRGVLFSNSVQPSQQINAGNFDFDIQSGIEAGLTAHRLFNDYDLDLRYIGMGAFNASQTGSFTSPGTPITTPTQFDVIGPRSAESEYASSLRSFEANLRYRFGGGHRWWSLLAGFRYLALEETLSTGLADPSRLQANSVVSTTTDNHLYGAQIGIDAPLLGNACYNIDCYGRIGVYGNNSNTATAFQSGLPGASVFGAKRDGNESSFVGELGIKATCRLSNTWNLYGRYQVLFVDDVALASQQLNSQHTAHGDVTFHGGTFGLEYIY